MATSYPRCFLSIGGKTIPCKSGHVHRSAKRAADTFSVTFSAQRAASLGFPLSFWADFQPQDCSVSMSAAVDGGDLRTMVTGQGDTPSIAWLKGEVTLKSRDKSASLTEKKRRKKDQNQSSSDIASSIFQDHGLTPQVQSSGDYAGLKYDQDSVNLSLNRSDWETLDDLAEREGYRWYVEGSNGYFEPDDSGDTFSVFYQPPTPGMVASGNVVDLTTSRNMSAARPQKVTVKSWHHKEGKLYSHTEEMSGSGDPIESEHHHNGRDQAQVEKLAKSRLKNAARHDMNVRIRMPGDLSCDVRMKLGLSGTSTIYDQSYDIDAVDFDMDGEGGFDMEIEAKSPKAGRSTGAGSAGSSSTTSSGGVGDAPLPPAKPEEFGGAPAAETQEPIAA